jgi:hypothetical protein
MHCNKEHTVNILNIKEQLVQMYLDWVNNYLTVEVFAEHYGLSVPTAQAMIDLGREFRMDLIESQTETIG